jgi:hypothetical protein
MRVMAGFVVPAIHALLGAKTWMPGTTGSPMSCLGGLLARRIGTGHTNDKTSMV